MIDIVNNFKCHYHVHVNNLPCNNLPCHLPLTTICTDKTEVTLRESKELNEIRVKIQLTYSSMTEAEVLWFEFFGAIKHQ